MPGVTKRDRQAKHIAKGYEKKGYPKKTAESIGYATVNKQKKRGKA
jgi:hypothetical protein